MRFSLSLFLAGLFLAPVFAKNKLSRDEQRHVIRHVSNAIGLWPQVFLFSMLLILIALLEFLRQNALPKGTPSPAWGWKNVLIAVSPATVFALVVVAIICVSYIPLSRSGLRELGFSGTAFEPGEKLDDD